MESGGISMGKSWWAGGLGGADEIRQPNPGTCIQRKQFSSGRVKPRGGPNKLYAFLTLEPQPEPPPGTSGVVVGVESDVFGRQIARIEAD